MGQHHLHMFHVGFMFVEGSLVLDVLSLVFCLLGGPQRNLASSYFPIPFLSSYFKVVTN